MADLYVVLLHHPVYDKNGAVVTTAVTNMDVHDIGRLVRTFDAAAFYVATPVPTLRRLVERIMRHWSTGPGAAYNETRKEALALVRLANDLDAVHSRQALVSQREVDILALEEIQRLLAAAGGEDLKTLELEGAPQGAQEDVVILDDQHSPLHRSLPPGGRSPRAFRVPAPR